MDKQENEIWLDQVYNVWQSNEKQFSFEFYSWVSQKVTNVRIISQMYIGYF